MFSLVRAGQEFKEEHIKNREALAKLGDMINAMSDKHEDFVGNFKTFREVITDFIREKK